MEHQTTVPLSVAADVHSNDSDCLVVVLEQIPLTTDSLSFLNSAISSSCEKVFESLKDKGTHLLECTKLISHGRLVLSFTGPLDREYDDVRRISEAAKQGLQCAIESGATRPVLTLEPLPTLVARLTDPWTHPFGLCLATLLGALECVFVPLEAREFSQTSYARVKPRLVDALFWLKSDAHPDIDDAKLTHIAWCLEEGRRVARDIGGGDPERMRTANIVKYLEAEFLPKSANVLVNNNRQGLVLTNVYEADSGLHPLVAIVDRGSRDRHRGRIVELEYIDSDEKQSQNVFLIGKGITYDTGGHDLKTKGIMRGMHRDKCGAASIAGFFKVISLLKPKSIGFYGKLAFVRNSIGLNAYVSDEIVLSRANMRVRIGNTDAEGRLVMSDLLCMAKEEARSLSNPHLFTIATLTGHVGSAYGQGYSAVLSNAEAEKQDTSSALQLAGSRLGEMHEISTLRREDFSRCRPADQDADLCNVYTSTSNGGLTRVHQSAAAFMMMAAGLSSKMTGKKAPLPYTHLDIASNNGPCPGLVSAVPVLTLSAHYLLADLWQPN